MKEVMRRPLGKDEEDDRVGDLIVLACCLLFGFRIVEGEERADYGRRLWRQVEPRVNGKRCRNRSGRRRKRRRGKEISLERWGPHARASKGGDARFQECHHPPVSWIDA